MHWLPIDLPPGVRFILSTGEFDKYPSDGTEPAENARLHKTWAELRRRKCPCLHMVPLPTNIRSRIIDAFVEKTQLELDSNQHQEIVSAHGSSDPMFLRTMLYAIRLGVEMSCVSIDEQISRYMCAGTTSRLIFLCFELCSKYVENCDTNGNQNILGRALAVLFASRNGLSDEEIWGSVEMSIGNEIALEARKSIKRILKDLTMVVNELSMFSHDNYRMAVYEMYIKTPEQNIRNHLLMAKYFGRLTVCPRKLENLPYHLEVSGSWTKLKTALANVDMFRLWWTSKDFKGEFINLWASLTDHKNPKTPIKKLVTSEFDSTMYCNQPSRPFLDIVEEYVKSCDEYKYNENPSPEELAKVILMVADFLLELATRRFEEQADVPQFIHPNVPGEDLATIGVPFLDVDKEGQSVLWTPMLNGEQSNGKVVGDAPVKMNDDIPVCSTYFYHRWMWIQFPWVAQGNCGKNFQKGMEFKREKERTLKGGPKKVTHVNKVSSTESKAKRKEEEKKKPETKKSGTVALLETNSTSEMLPMLPYNKRTQSHTRRTNNHLTIARAKDKCGMDEDAVENQIIRRVEDLREEIDSYRQKLDQLKQQRVKVEKQKDALRDEVNEVSRWENGSSDMEAYCEELEAKIELKKKVTQEEKHLHKNNTAVYLMCERHPAHSQALIDELEIKLKADTAFIEAVRQRLREQEFEAKRNAQPEKQMHKTINEASAMQQTMLSHRHQQLEILRKIANREAGSEERRDSFTSTFTKESTGKQNKKSSTTMGRRASMTEREDFALMQSLKNWETWQTLIHQRTGISDPAVFFDKFENQGNLERQMTEMRQAADIRLRQLKEEEVIVEQAVEQSRYSAQAAGLNSGEVRKLQEILSSKQSLYKHKKERTDVAEKLGQTSLSGLKHVCDILGMPEVDKETVISEIIRNIMQYLDVLIEEKDNNTRNTEEENQIATRGPAMATPQAPELVKALAQYETPKSMVAHRLHGRIVDDAEYFEEEDEGNDQMDARAEVKGASIRSIKAEQRRVARAAAIEQNRLKRAMAN